MTIKSKPYLLLSVIALLSLMSGCAKQHTVIVNGKSLVFQYRDDKAKEIILATSLDNFAYHRARRENNDLWIVHVPIQNEFSYFYIVDGQVKLPECPNSVFDDFGGKNCIYVHAM